LLLKKTAAHGFLTANKNFSRCSHKNTKFLRPFSDYRPTLSPPGDRKRTKRIRRKVANKKQNRYHLGRNLSFHALVTTKLLASKELMILPPQ
jgi:hypothetical protein